MNIFKNWQVEIVTAVVLLVMFPVAAEAAATRDNYDALLQGYYLELDGVPAGPIHDFGGGGIYTDVIEQLGPDYSIKKHAGQLKYEEITITVGPNMEPVFYKWIQDTLENKYPRKSGSIVTADRSYDFTDALISEISFPELDPASKDLAYITVKLQPEFIKLNTAGSETSEFASSSENPSKKLLPSNFRLKIDGLSTNRIQKIDAITIKNEIVTNAVGDAKNYQNQPGKLSVSNLVVTMSEGNDNAQSFLDWYDDFMVKGNNGDAKEKTGTIEFLSPNQQDVMLKLTLEHLGISKLSSIKRSSGEGTNSLKVEMYGEKILFDYPAEGSDSLGTISPDEANKETPSASASPTATGQTTPTVDEQTTTETLSLVTLQGKLTSSTTGKPVETGSVQVTIKDLSGEQIWQGTFDGSIEKGEFNIQLGAAKELVLVPNTMYQMVVEIDAESSKFSKADVTFGDNSPAGDIVKFKV